MNYERINFGNRVAEDEENQLPDYFLSTRYWKNLINGKIDVILGPKGSGKSALYLNLLSKEIELKSRSIFLFKAENPRGDTIFSLFNQITATSTYESPKIEYLIEQDIIAFWKLYFLTIIVSELKKEEQSESELKKVIGIFEECGLIPQEKNLKNIFRHVIHYLKQVVTLQFFQPEIELDPLSGTIKSIKGKISFEELSPKKIEEGHYTLDDLFNLINEGLKKSNNQVWVAIDRLDVAFQEDLTLEKRALKSLFIVYNSLKRYSNINLKIFLRDDIWEKITTDGLREASHITKKETIEWNENNTYFLILKRIVKSNEICDLYDCNEQGVLNSIENQRELFNLIFPTEMKLPNGESKPTFEWILEMLKDGNNLFTPREIVHLLNEINSTQEEMARFGNRVEGNKLYSEEALKNSIKEVSKVKFEQTLMAENPHLADSINMHFRYANPKINLDWIKETFELPNDNQAHGFCEAFQKVGFLKRLNMNEYWIPYLYQEALK